MLWLRVVIAATVWLRACAEGPPKFPESDLICHLLPNSSVVRKNGSDYGKVLEVSLNNRLVEVQWDGEEETTEYDNVGAPGWEEEFQLHQEANASSHETVHNISGPSASGLLRVGTIVVRGPDWRYGCQDGVPRKRGRVIGIATASTGKAMPHWHLVQWQDGYLGQYLMGQEDKQTRFELAIPTHDQDFLNAAVHEDWSGLLRNGSCVVGGKDRQTGDEQWEEYQLGRVVVFDASQDAGWMYVRWRSGIGKNYTMGKSNTTGKGWAPLGLSLRLLDDGKPSIENPCGMEPCAGFVCRDMTCVKIEFKCNGPKDCPDGSDEDEEVCGDSEFETSFRPGDWKMVEAKWQLFHKNIQIGAFSNVSGSLICISADQGNKNVSFRAHTGCNWQGDFCKDKSNKSDDPWTLWLPEAPDIVSTMGVKFVVHRRPRELAVWVFDYPTTPPATVPLEEGVDRLRVRPDAGSWFMDITVNISDISESEAAVHAHGLAVNHCVAPGKDWDVDGRGGEPPQAGRVVALGDDGVVKVRWRSGELAAYLLDAKLDKIHVRSVNDSECGECDEFRCNNTVCILNRELCDGKKDCEDGSDELSAQCPLPWYLIAVAVTSVVLVIIVALVLLKTCLEKRKVKRKWKQSKLNNLYTFGAGMLDSLDPHMTAGEQAEFLPYDYKFEFPRDRLVIGRTLGSGAFGIVKKAKAYRIVQGETETAVAVKMVKQADECAMKALIAELKVMVHLGKHVNVISLLGACTRELDKMELYVITELCTHGCLRDYLFDNREKFEKSSERRSLLQSERPSITDATCVFNPSYEADVAMRAPPRNNHHPGLGNDHHVETAFEEIELGGVQSNSNVNSRLIPSRQFSVPAPVRELTVYAFQVARGMEYLANRNVLHGDLAARNILLTDNNVIKICDFGLATRLYRDSRYVKKSGMLPVKWMAIESIRDRKFSTQSDVWSFGVVLWELFSLAQEPYPELSAGDCLDWLLEGRRMPRPVHSSKRMYKLMLQCWHELPGDRPSFPELVNDIGDLLEDDVRQLYVEMNEPYERQNALARSRKGYNDYLAASPARACSADGDLTATPHSSYENIADKP